MSLAEEGELNKLEKIKICKIKFYKVLKAETTNQQMDNKENKKIGIGGLLTKN